MNTVNVSRFVIKVPDSACTWDTQILWCAQILWDAQILFDTQTLDTQYVSRRRISLMHRAFLKHRLLRHEKKNILFIHYTKLILIHSLESDSRDTDTVRCWHTDIRCWLTDGFWYTDRSRDTDTLPAWRVFGTQMHYVLDTHILDTQDFSGTPQAVP